MLTKETLQADLQSAIRSKDDVRKRTLRLALTKIKLVEVDRRDTLDERTLFGILQKEVKTRQESIEEAKKANREDIITAAKAEIAVIQEYLPQPLTQEELEDLTNQVIQEIGATGPKSMGEVMKMLMPRVQGRADGVAVSNLVRDKLSDV
jgi:uncharacterized protein YqeY